LLRLQAGFEDQKE